MAVWPTVQTHELCPLGAAALAGTSYPINRHMTAEALGFSAPTENSLTRSVIETLLLNYAAAAITMMHLSRMAEEMIIWTSAQFAFVDLPIAFAPAPRSCRKRKTLTSLSSSEERRAGYKGISLH